MATTWRKGLSLERVDNNGNYEPKNCQWITFVNQGKNRSTTYIIEFGGKKMCVGDWEKVLGFKSGTIRARLRYYGWTIEQALTTKPDYGNSKKKI